jgi:hypothetical protein
MVSGVQPGRADNCQQHPAGRHRPENLIGEVNTGLDRVHINENLILAEMTSQAVIEPASQMGSLAAGAISRLYRSFAFVAGSCGE